MFTEIRDAVITSLKTDLDSQYPNLPVAWPNLNFNWNQPPEEFVAVEIEFYSGSQVGISAQPKSRVRGTVSLTYYAREGLGTRSSAQFFDWTLRLAYAKLGPANLQAPMPEGSNPWRGYLITTVGFPFFSDPG